jgi:hypothetical protein
MFIPDPDFSHPRSQIPDFGFPDPGSNNIKKEEGEKIVVLPFFVVINFTKLTTVSLTRGRVSLLICKNIIFCFHTAVAIIYNLHVVTASVAAGEVSPHGL